MNLFNDTAAKLRATGCTPAGHSIVGRVPLWRLPDGRVAEEAAALRWLEEKERKT